MEHITKNLDKSQAVKLSHSGFHNYMTKDNDKPYKAKNIDSPYIRKSDSLLSLFDSSDLGTDH